MSERDAQRLDRKLDRIARRLPRWAARPLRWLRSPSSRWVRLPLAALLILGGIVGFLPVLGLWMVPLGILLLAQDVPLLRKPVLRLLNWVERTWMRWKRRSRTSR